MYVKTYGVITKIIYHGRGSILYVDINGINIIVDGNGYMGKRPQKIAVGSKIKMYQRPQDRRPFVYKLVGE